MLIAFREKATRHDLNIARILRAKFNTFELYKDIPEESESIPNCKVLYNYHTDGPNTFIRLGQHSITDPLPIVLHIGGTSGNRGRRTCFFTAADPMHEPSEIPSCEIHEARMAPYKTYQDTVHWFDLEHFGKHFPSHHTKPLDTCGLLGQIGF